LVYFINKNVTACLGFHPIFIHYENWKNIHNTSLLTAVRHLIDSEKYREVVIFRQFKVTPQNAMWKRYEECVQVSTKFLYADIHYHGVRSLPLSRDLAD
jgi:hypothetical protein